MPKKLKIQFWKAKHAMAIQVLEHSGLANIYDNVLYGKTWTLDASLNLNVFNFNTNAERVRRWKAALRPESGDSYLIDDDQTTRRLNITAREANTWIKKFIPGRKKGLHELRKMATSDFLRSTNGDVYRVANIIGDNPRTMLNYYAAVLKMDVVAL